MSYDLYFKRRTYSFDEREFIQYFQGRPFYKHEGSQAWYENEDTGVYFVFEFQSKGKDDAQEEHFPVALNINYFRPSYFILEAEPEVTAFVEHFDMLVSDPQINGIGEGGYSAEKLLSGWNSGNEFGYSAFLNAAENGNEVFHLPTKKLLQAWEWNFRRSALQTQLGESTFVPRIMFLNIGGTTATAAVWPDGIPVVAPEVDYLCVPRKELAPTKFFRKQEDTTFVSWNTVQPILLKHGTRNQNGSVTLNYLNPPPEVGKFVQSLPKETREIAGISADRVLDREIYERSLA